LAQLEAKEGIVAGAHQKRGRVAWLSVRGDQEPSLAELEGHGNYLYMWAFLVAQLVKNPPAMQETPLQLLGQKDPLEKR